MYTCARTRRPHTRLREASYSSCISRRDFPHRRPCKACTHARKHTPSTPGNTYITTQVYPLQRVIVRDRAQASRYTTKYQETRRIYSGRRYRYPPPPARRDNSDFAAFVRPVDSGIFHGRTGATGFERNSFLRRLISPGEEGRLLGGEKWRTVCEEFSRRWVKFEVHGRPEAFCNFGVRRGGTAASFSRKLQWKNQVAGGVAGTKVRHDPPMVRRRGGPLESSSVSVGRTDDSPVAF